MINVELKGGTVKEFESGVTPAELQNLSVWDFISLFVVRELTAM